MVKERKESFLESKGLYVLVIVLGVTFLLLSFMFGLSTQKELALPGISLSPEQTELFNFTIVNARSVWLNNLDIADGKIGGILILDGDENQFLGTGAEGVSSRLTVSSLDKIKVYHQNQIILSADMPGGGSSYWLSVKIEDYQGFNTTTVMNVITGENCFNKKAGEQCSFGGISLGVEDVFRNASESWAVFNVSSQTGIGRFDRLYDINGNYINLPTENMFPMSGYSIEVFNKNGEVIETHEFFRSLPSIEKSSLFSFSTLGNYVSVTVPTKNYEISVPVLYGDGTNFLGTGSGPSDKLAVSDGDALMINFSHGDGSLVASWNSDNDYESFAVKMSKTYDFDEALRTDFSIQTAPGNWQQAYPGGYLAGIGRRCDLSRNCAQPPTSGRAILGIAGMYNGTGKEWINLSIGTGGSFNKLFDSIGNYITLPIDYSFPASSIGFNVYNISDGSLIGIHNFDWVDGAIQETSNYFGKSVLEESVWFNVLGSDLSLNLYPMPTLIMGEDSLINMTIYNNGDKNTENAKISFYYQRGYCYRETCDNLTFVESKEIDVNAREFADETFLFNAPSEDYYTLVFIANASNEVNSEDNNFYYSRDIKRGGADVSIGFEWFDNLIKGEQNEINLTLYNLGTEDARDMEVHLYSVDYNKFEGDIYTLIGSSNLASLGADSSKTLSMLYTPSKKGDIMLFANVSVESDVDLENNQNYFWTNVLNNGLDGAISYVYISNAIVGREGTIYAEVTNNGNENITGASLVISINNEVVGSVPVNLPVGTFAREEFSFTPQTSGDYSMTATLYLFDDIDLTDNLYETLIHASNSIKFNLTVTDNAGNNVMRFIGAENPHTEIFGSNRTYEIEVLEDGNLMIGNIFYNGSLEELNEDLIDSATAISMSPLNVLPSESIITEHYDSLVDRGENYYYVSVNKPSFNYSYAGIAEVISEGVSNRIGINYDFVNDYGLFVCEKFNIAGRTCESGWNETNSMHYASYKNTYIGSTFEGRAEAFALRISSGFSGDTTDLSEIASDMTDNLVLEKEIYGKIRFLGAVNVSRLKQNSELLEEAVKISYKKIKVDTSILPELANVPAEITLRNIHLRNAQVLRNGVLCSSSVCTLVSYDNASGILVFRAAGFSEFEIVEGLACGDGSCNSGETCTNCAGDCGACTIIPVTSGGSTCIPKWNCTWGPCTNGLETRTCIKLNPRCPFNGTLPAPPETRSCGGAQTNCTAVWSCNWGDCINGEESKTCVKTNPSCADNSGMPGTEKRNCTGAVSDKKNYGWLWWIIPIVILVTAIIIGIIMLVKSMKNRKETVNTPISNVPVTAASEADMSVKAKALISQFKQRGYSEKEIRDAFKEKGWNDKDIAELL